MTNKEIVYKILMGMTTYQEALKDLDEKERYDILENLFHDKWWPQDNFESMPELKNYPLFTQTHLCALMDCNPSKEIEDRIVESIKTANGRYYDFPTLKNMTPRIQKGLDEIKDIGARMSIFYLLSVEGKKKIIKDVLKRYLRQCRITNEKAKEDGLKILKVGGRVPTSKLKYIPKGHSYLDRMYQQEFKEWWKKSDADSKSKLQRIIACLDINQVIKDWWHGSKGANRIAFLSNPDLPEDYTIEALKTLEKYKSNRINPDIAVKITWDLLRKAIKKKLGCSILHKGINITGNNPLTEEELNRWIFPKLIKSDETKSDLKDKFKEVYLKIRYPMIERLKEVKVRTAKEWLKIVGKTDETEDIVLKVLLYKSWDSLIESYNRLKKYPIKLYHFTIDDESLREVCSKKKRIDSYSFT